MESGVSKFVDGESFKLGDDGVASESNEYIIFESVSLYLDCSDVTSSE